MILYQDFNIQGTALFVLLKSYVSFRPDFVVAFTESLYISTKVTSVTKTHMNEQCLYFFL